MFQTPAPYLFSSKSLSELISESRAKATRAVASFDAEDILNKPIDDLADIIFGHFKIDVPALRRDAEFMSEPVETAQRTQDYGRYINLPGMLYKLNIPFDGNPDLFAYQPNAYLSVPPSGDVQQRTLIIKVSGHDLTADQTRGTFEKTVEEVEQYLGWQRSLVDPYNDGIRADVKAKIDQRKTTLLQSRSMAASLGYKMQPQLPYPTTHRAPQITRKPTPVGRSTAAKTFVSEPELVEEDYQHILGIIEAMSHVMERSPRSFSHLGEEDLRQHLLVPLNGHYKGEGTAEAFNNIGKTDILIRVEDKNIFIAECKVWDGDKILSAAIDQLLGYLTWRDTKTALIMFSHLKDFTYMLDTMWKSIEAHPNFKRMEKIESETRRRYAFRNKTDPDRELFMTALAFNIPDV